MLLQMYSCVHEERWFPALASLFLLVEQTLRMSASAKKSETLKDIIKRLSRQGLISKDEMSILNTLRDFRNGYIHSDFFGQAWAIDNLVYQASEEETAEKIFQTVGMPCLEIIYKLTVKTNK